MKPLSILFPICISFLCFTDLHSQWINQESGTGGYLFSVDFVDQDNGWIVYRDSVLRTSNGGLSWNKQWIGLPSGFAVHAVDFIDTERGWACGSDTAGRGLVMRSTDGGVTWSDLGPGIGTFMSDVFFLNEWYGWAFGQDGCCAGVIIHTSDGGDTWVEQQVPAVGYLKSGFFVDSLVGWAVGNSVILKTTNGGDVWFEQDTAYTYPVPLGSTFFFNADSGWIVGGIGGFSIMAKTLDGGETWEHHLYDPPNPIDRLYWIHFVNDTTGWCVGRSNEGEMALILMTTDGGETWARQVGGVDWQLFCVVFTDENHGWATGEGGTILATTNGGVSFVAYQNDIPFGTALLSAYPNPFNASTTITFTLNHSGHVTLTLYDLLGREVQLLADGVEVRGMHTRILSSDGLSSGVYILRMNVAESGENLTPRTFESRKIVVLK